MSTNLFSSNRNKEPTWEDLLDRESKEKDYRRDRRNPNASQNFRKQSDVSKEENKNKKIVDLQKEFEELKSKIRHVENKNERMLTQLRTHNPDEEPIQDRSSPLLRDNQSKARVSKESLGKGVRRMDKSLNANAFQSDYLPQLTVTSAGEKRSKTDLKYIVDAALSLKKKQESFEKLITSKLRELGDRIVQTQQLSKLCTDFQTLKDTSAIEEKESSEIFSMKSKQLELIINELERDKSKLKGENRELKIQIQDMKTKHEVQKDNFYREIEELRASSLVKLSESEGRYQKLVVKHGEEIEQLRKEFVPVLDDSRVWREDEDRVIKENEVEMLKYQQEHLNGMIQQLRSELEHEKSRAISLTNEKDKAEFELQKLQLSYSVEDYNQQLSNYRSENQTLMSQLKSLRRDKQQLQSQMNTLRRQNKEYLLKINKKEQFRIEIQQTYKSKLKQQNKLTNTLREQKRRQQMQSIQVKSFNKNLLAQKQKFSKDIISEIKKILSIQGDPVIKTILQNYTSNPHILALQVMRIITQRKITQDEFRKKLVERGIVVEKDCNQGVRIEFLAVENLWEQNRRLLREVEERGERLRVREEEWEGEREVIQEKGVKLRRSLEEARRSHEEEMKSRSLEGQPSRDEENNKFNEMKSLILRAESEKKQLQNKIKILQIEQSNLNETKQNLTKKREKAELEKEEIRISLQKEIGVKEERIRKLQTDLRENKEEYSRKKTQFTMENKRLQFNLSEMQIKIQKVNGELEEKGIILGQKEEELRKRKEDAGSLQGEVKEMARKLAQSENKLKVQEQELREKIAESLGLNSSVQELKGRISQLEGEMKEKSGAMQKQKLKSEEEKNSNEGTLTLMNENIAFMTKRLEEQGKEMEKMQQRFKESIEEKNRIELELEEQRHLVEERQREKEELGKRVKQLEGELEQAEDRIRLGAEEQNTYSYNLKEITDFNNKKIGKLESRIKELEESNKSLADSLASKEKELSTLRMSKQEQADELANRNQQTGIRLRIREKELEEKEKQILYETTKMEAQKSRLQSLQSELELKQKQIQEQAASIKTQLQEIETLKQSHKNVLGESLLASKVRTNPIDHDLKKSSFNLQGYDVSDNFQIGEVQSKQQGGSPNSAIIDFFLRIKVQIQKIIYGQQLSVQIFQVIPIEIQNQFQDLLNTIRTKVNDNQLSFIFIDQHNADTMLGDSIMEQFPEINKEIVTLKRRVSEQQKIIVDLTSEKGHHQHTINQMTQEMEEIEEENEARFIGQLSVLKSELKALKLKTDNMEINIAATKKTLFNVLEILVSEEEGMEEDLAESLNYYNNVTKAPEKEKKQLASYFDRYAAKVK